MKKYLLIVLFPAMAFAMGDKPDSTEKDVPEKIIIESEELCDPSEQTEMPRFY